MLPELLPGTEHSLLAFPLSIRETSKINRKKLMTYLEMNGVQTRLLFAGNILHHPAYEKISHRKVNALPGATYIMKYTFLLPNHHGLSDEQLAYLFEVFGSYMSSAAPKKGSSKAKGASKKKVSAAA